MDDSQSFTSLLRSIENSQLDFSMTRKPFAAKILVKNDENQVSKQEVYTINVKVRIKEVENENAGLRTRLEKVADAASEA